jgi:hypothetical protein
MIEGGGIKLELLTVRGSRSVTVRGNSSGNGINWRLLVASRRRNRPVGEDLPLRVVFPLDELTNKPKPRGAVSRDGTRVSLCMGILIPAPKFSGGDKAVKVAVVPYRVSGLI